MYRQFNIQQHSCIYVFCVDLRTNSDYFPKHHYLTGFYNGHLTLYTPVAWPLCSPALSAVNSTCGKQIIMFSATPRSMSIITRAVQSQPNGLHCPPPPNCLLTPILMLSLHVHQGPPQYLFPSDLQMFLFVLCTPLTGAERRFLLQGGSKESCKCCGAAGVCG